MCAEGSSLSGWRRQLLALLVVLISIGHTWITPASALEIEFSGRRVKRDVIALYDSRRERLPHETRIHKFAEMPLNHLGFRVLYRDVNAPLPNPTTLSGVQGVLTWFVEPLRRPEQVVDWLDRATANGLKLVILGEIAPPDQAALMPQINRVLGRLGLEHTGEYIDLTWRAFAVEQNADVVGFERPIDKALPGFPVLRKSGSEVEPYLLIEYPAAGGGRHTARHCHQPRRRLRLSQFHDFLRAEYQSRAVDAEPVRFLQASARRRTFPDTGRDHGLQSPDLFLAYRRRRLEQSD